MANNINKNKEKFYRTMAYIPLLNITFLFTDIEKSKDLQKHINAGLVLFGLYILFAVILSVVLPFYALGLKSLLLLAYICLFSFLAFKAYEGEYIELPFIEELVKKIPKENFKQSDKSSEQENEESKNGGDLFRISKGDKD